ncbi:hypothetical protein ACIBCR_16145 [Micromonospora echinospora]|uniref:hypothetical protein n=1 Tax=Micromonospora echinospora TaxID=1877 RepID=UPI0037B42BC1
MESWWARRRVLVMSAAAVALLAGALGWLLWPEPEAPPAPRERQYRAFTACLLTDDRGIAGEQARAVWDGMQRASLAHSIQVQYLTVDGPQTAANAAAYFNSLALRQCQVVIAVGEAPVGALIEGKGRFPSLRYVVVGEASQVDGVTFVPETAGDRITSTVESTVGDLVGSVSN